MFEALLNSVLDMSKNEPQVKPELLSQDEEQKLIREVLKFSALEDAKLKG